MTSNIFDVNVDLCTGCQLCVIACKDEHVSAPRPPWADQQSETGQFWIRIDTIEAGPTPRVQVAHLPVMCQHCHNAPCITVCPEGAIKRRPDGLVWIDPETCNGCGLCEAACPYDVIYPNAELGIAQKCTGCAQRIDEDLQPRCVEMCPHDALTFTDAAERDDEPNPTGEVFHPEYLTEPRVGWSGLPAVSIAGRLLNNTGSDVVIGATVLVQDLAVDATYQVESDAFGEFRWKGEGVGHSFLVTVSQEGQVRTRQVVTGKLGVDLGTVNLPEYEGQ